MRARCMISAAVVTIGVAGSLVSLAFAQFTPSVPRVSGFKTPTGIRIVSHDSDNPFALELTGNDIKPISANRLVWLVDGNEIELLSEQRSWDIPASASDVEVLRASRKSELEVRGRSGWTPQGPEEEFAFPTGEKCLYWALSRNPTDFQLYATTVNVDHVIVLVALHVDRAREEQVHDYLKRTLLSLRRGELLEADKSHPDVKLTGTPLQKQVAMYGKLLGRPAWALLNSSLMTAADEKVQSVVPLNPVTLLEVIVLQLETGYGIFEPEAGSLGEELRKAARQAFGEGTPNIQVSVFDGQSSHAINLFGFDEESNRFKYAENWPKGSFLTPENNHAGVAAIPSSTEEGMWLVKADELERVLYSVVEDEREILALFRLCTALAGPPDGAITTYRDIQTRDPNSPEILGRRLNTIQDYLIRRKHLDQAITLYRVRVALYPASTVGKTELVQALSAAGKSGMEVELDRPVEAHSEPSPIRDTLSAAKKTDFFAFFHLEQTDVTTDAGHRNVVSFRPAAPVFHDLVELKVTKGQADMVSVWTLSLSRSIIDDPRTERFASDIAKSFLQLTVPKAGSDAVGDLRDQIWNHEGKQVPVLAARMPNTALPALPSRGYLTYKGGEEKYEQSLSGGTLRLNNVRSAGSAQLLISVAVEQ